MNKTELQEASALKAEAEVIKRRLEFWEQRSESLKSASEILKLTKLYKAKLEIAAKKERKIEKYIIEISNPYIRTIFRLKYFENYSYNQIAQKLGGNNTSDGIRKIIYREIKKQNCRH